MLKTIFTFFLLTLSLNILNAQKEAVEISWKDERPLKWDDFQGRPDKKSPYFALTYSGISFSSSMEGNQLSINVTCTFNKRESWVKKGKETPDLLTHEQMHFHITELHARKIRQAVSKLEIKTQKDMKKVESIFNDLFKANKKMQHQYDHETKHSIIKEEQEKWNKFILSELKKLEAFKTS